MKDILKQFLKKNKVQQPVLIIALFVVMLISLWCVLMFLPKQEGQVSETAPMGLKDVRSGTQTVSVKIVPHEEEDSLSTGETDTADTAAAEAEPGSEIATETSLEVMEAESSMVNGTVPSGEMLKFKIDNFKKLAVQPLKFQLFDTNGRELTPDFLKSIQGEKVHLYMVNAGLTEFSHVIPVYQNGTWNASINMPTPGTYYAYVVNQPLDGSLRTYRADLTVRDPSPADINGPDPGAALEFSDGKRTAKMMMQRLDSGRMFTYELTSEGAPAGADPYLESYGQMTIFKQHDPSAFTSVTTGGANASRPGTFYFSAGKLTPGRYTAFAEFKIGGKVYVFPITFDVGEL